GEGPRQGTARVRIHGPRRHRFGRRVLASACPAQLARHVQRNDPRLRAGRRRRKAKDRVRSRRRAATGGTLRPWRKRAGSGLASADGRLSRGGAPSIPRGFVPKIALKYWFYWGFWTEIWA